MNKITAMFKIWEVLLLLFGASLAVALWRIDQDWGWLSSIVMVSTATYYVNHYRIRPMVASSSLRLLLGVFAFFFLLALLLGLRHPPFLAVPDFQWPPFQSLWERIVHSFALSLWVFYFGTPTILGLGFARRVASFIAPNTIS